MFSARTFSLFAILFGTWLLLSGHWDPLLVTSGAISSLLVVVIAHRMDITDGEGHPIQLAWHFLLYIPWLAWQIVLSNLTVARIILSPRMKLDAGCDWVDASQKTTVGLVAYANSITLTPGTVSLSVHPGRIHVHALSRAGLEELKRGNMDRRVRAIEGKD
ncbi:MAG: Na+/H+ antiporter subunit E [Alphaproteobacteria bacterium]|nr:Na+/H+ antiporter subunit E [Alphaproteobacteria bacterium]